uniref:Uncharacterized protein n=1 Tax=Amphimedon queenslandica TaxID=400682 RepID=A0A1X7V992_AMPQE
MARYRCSSAINDALSPLVEFTDVMSGEQYVTISAVLPIVNLLKTSDLKESSSDKALTNELHLNIITDLSNRNQEDDVLHLLEVACFLDPRFKDKFISSIEHTTEIMVCNVVSLSSLSVSPTSATSFCAIHHPSSSGDPPPTKNKIDH